MADGVEGWKMWLSLPYRRIIVKHLYSIGKRRIASVCSGCIHGALGGVLVPSRLCTGDQSNLYYMEYSA
jgi:hypothetical protein